MFRSFVVPSSEVPGFSPIYRHPRYKDGTQNKEFADIKTLYDLFISMVASHPKKEFLGTREFYPETDTFGDFKWISTTDSAEIVDHIGAGLDSIYAQYAPEPNETTGQQPMGIFSINRWEWLLAELAALRSRRYVVGITDIAGVDSSEYVINFADTRVIVCSIDKIPRMLDRMDKTPNLKAIISMDKLDCSKPTVATQAFSAEVTDKLKAQADSLGVVLMDLDQVIQIGKANPTEPTLPSPDDLCNICFTSGTTGAQKGAFLTHKNLIYSAKANYLHYRPKNTTILSYMSRAHIYDRILVYFLMLDIVRVGFFSGDVSRVLDDMQVLRPTFFATVPPVLNRMYDKIASNTIGAKGIKGLLCRMAYKSKEKRITSGRGYKHFLWDRIVFNKVAKLFGGEIELAVCGGTIFASQVQNFMRACLSCDVTQVFGQTETSGTSMCQERQDFSTGTCGVPTPGVDLRLRSIPEMGYNVTDSPCPRGELLIRGDHISKGYYQEPEKTAELMEDGWMVTGDIVTVNTDGTFTIVERIKNAIRSASTVYIEPGPLEVIYSNHHLISQCYVYGSSRIFKLVAIVVPRPETFVPWARNIAKSPKAELIELCESKEVAEALTQELLKLGSEARVPSPAMIGAVHLEPKPLEQVNSQFYSTALKIRRHLVNQHYMPVFDKLCETVDFTTDPKFSEIKSSEKK
ncbi:medium-chain fatty acid-CoA ligase faa2 [Coemansia erecta]|nr:medium-chain fatty acid-CoA ligase faa2 [Coemansia erecta]